MGEKAMIFKYTIEQAREMANREPRLQDVIDRLGMIEREMEPDLYLGVIKSIVSQQISTGAYQTIWNKIAELAKEVRPDTIAALSRESLQACGLSWRKVDYILEFSQAVVAGVVDLDYLAGLPNEEFVKELVKIRGIGPWTARMILIFTLGRLDVISFDDLAIIRGLKRLYQKDTLSKDELEHFAKIVHPYESIASLYLWELSHDSKTGLEKDGKAKSESAVYSSSLGDLKITYLDGVVIGIDWTSSGDPGIKTALTDRVYSQLEEYFAGTRTTFDFPYRLEGTPFQLQVWHELEKIPYGVTCSYKDIAIAIGNEKAVRAVGGANNKNPMAIVVPCHRVIGTNRKLVGYAAGVEIKQLLLDLESANEKRGS